MRGRKVALNARPSSTLAFPVTKEKTAQEKRKTKIAWFDLLKPGSFLNTGHLLNRKH